MADILEQIAEHNRVIYLDRKLEVSLSEVKDMAYASSEEMYKKVVDFENATVKVFNKSKKRKKNENTK